MDDLELALVIISGFWFILTMADFVFWILPIILGKDENTPEKLSVFASLILILFLSSTAAFWVYVN